MNTTPIEWADKSLNLFIPEDGKGWACVKVSPGCKNCYAERLNHVRGNGKAFTLSNLPPMTLARDRLKAIKTVAKNHETVFINSMTDTFLESVPEDLIAEALDALLAAAGNNRTFIILTKRHERMRQLIMSWLGYRRLDKVPDHIILGVSAESQEWADKRLPYLMAIPARRMVSAEPLIGRLDLTRYLKGLDWLIAGGESGPYNAPTPIRACHPDWLSEMAEDAAAYKVPFFFKQWGEWVNQDELSLAGLKQGLHYRVTASGLLSYSGEWLTTDEGDSHSPGYHAPAIMVRTTLKKAPATLNGVAYAESYRPAEPDPVYTPGRLPF